MISITPGSLAFGDKNHVEWLEKEQQIHIYFHIHNEEKMMYVPYDSPAADCFLNTLTPYLN